MNQLTLPIETVKERLGILKQTAKFLQDTTDLQPETSYGRKFWFNMKYWFRESDLMPSCQTSACAIGTMMLLFPDCGLKLVSIGHSDSGYTYLYPYHREGIIPANRLDVLDVLINYFGGTFNGEDISMMFFPGSYVEFPLSSSIPPAVVGNRIMDYVEMAEEWLATMSGELSDDRRW